VATVVSAMLSLVQSVSSKTAVAQMASRSAIKRASVEGLLDFSLEARVVADHYGEGIGQARVQVAHEEQAMKLAGF